ncbi:hypothetical protein BP5796_09275 [Coleophoma crateriformis]|uniref:DUF7029 domain-containing protein n=1 Tax=Coleophoma crateriformis TaxID=565419 RepID=A0A3D8R3T9_9HELO|nr:hypothetical protein BP5796_09275 [Coleophoma crateriformis]
MKWSALVLLGASCVLAFPQEKYPTRRNTVITLPNNSSLIINNSTASVEPDVATTKTVHVSKSTQISVIELIEIIEEEISVSTATIYEFPTAKLGPVPTLLPIIPTTHDMDNIEHLSPKDPGRGASIHYAQESQSEYSPGVYAVVTPNWNSPSVVLDHSAAIVNVEVSDLGNLIVTFQDQVSFEHSSAAWNIKNLIFITYTPNCGAYEQGQRCYYQASQIVLHPDSLSIIIIGHAYALEVLTINIDVSWGSYGSQPVYFSGGGEGDSSTSGAAPTASSSPSTNAATPTAGVYPAPTPACVAPPDTKYGLPTACLGSSFDDDLDTALGFFNISDFDYASFAEGIDLESGSNGTFVTLSRRAFFEGIKNFGNKIADTTTNAVKDAKNAVTTKLTEAKKDIAKVGADAAALGTKLANGAKDVAKLAKSIITGTPIPFSKDVDKLLLPQPAKDCKPNKRNCKPVDPDLKAIESPWGDDAILLKAFGTAPKLTELVSKGGKKSTSTIRGRFVNIYCVRCGLQGSLKSSGSITIDLLHGITAGFVNADIDISIGIGLGIYAQDILEKTIRNNLFDVPLSPFTLGFITVGPFLSIGTELTLTANMTGSALARADVKIAQAKFSYDFAKGGKIMQSGFKPEFKPSFEAEGEIILAAQLGVPVALEFGFTVGNGCSFCKGSIALETKPSIRAAATVAAQASYNNETMKFEASFKPINNCSGISTTLSVRNDVNAAVKGFGIFNHQFPLHQTKDYILASYCIGNKTDGTPKGIVGLQGRSLGIKAPSHPEHITRRDSFNGSTTSNSSSSSNATLDDIVDLTQYVVNELDDIGYKGPNIPTIPYMLDVDAFPGYFFTTLNVQGFDGELVLASCSDGNVYIQANTTEDSLPFDSSCATLWAGYEDVILSTPTGGILHYYNNTMSVVNVSRLRTADDSELPGTAVLLSLGPFYYTAGDDTDTGASILAAVDPDDNLFFPVVCTYTNSSSSKIYLVTEDIDAGIAILKSPDVIYSITNGQVDECYPLYLEIFDPTLGAFDQLDINVDSNYATNPLDLEFNTTEFDQNGDLVVPAEDIYSPSTALLDYNDDMEPQPEDPIEFLTPS